MSLGGLSGEPGRRIPTQSRVGRPVARPPAPAPARTSPSFLARFRPRSTRKRHRFAMFSATRTAAVSGLVLIFGPPEAIDRKSETDRESSPNTRVFPQLGDIDTCSARRPTLRLAATSR